jgi:hypothetical protein
MSTSIRLLDSAQTSSALDQFIDAKESEESQDDRAFADRHAENRGIKGKDCCCSDQDYRNHSVQP